MSKKINLDAFPEGVFDFSPIGHNLTRELLAEITKDWTPGHYAAFEANGYGSYLITQPDPKAKGIPTDPASETGTPTDKK